MHADSCYLFFEWMAFFLALVSTVLALTFFFVLGHDWWLLLVVAFMWVMVAEAIDKARMQNALTLPPPPSFISP